MSETFRYEQLAEALARLGYPQDAAEYHGALCGALCVRPPEDIDPVGLLAPDAAADSAGAEAQALHKLAGQSAEAFSGVQMAFNPLLPDDEEGLERRVRALSAWCEGFLFGLSTGRALNMKLCSPEFKEIVRDFTDFTHAGIGEGEGGEVEETAYAELVEYIRVGAQLIYLELHEGAGAPAPAPRIH